MQPIRLTMPELHFVRYHAITTPVRGERDVAISKVAVQPFDFAFQRGAICEHPALF